MLAAPVIITQWWRDHGGRTFLVELRHYEGRTVVDARGYYTAREGRLQPSKDGLTRSVRHPPKIASALTSPTLKARELGTLEDGA